jgi:hypothetical protein
MHIYHGRRRSTNARCESLRGGRFLRFYYKLSRLPARKGCSFVTISHSTHCFGTLGDGVTHRIRASASIVSRNSAKTLSKICGGVFLSVQASHRLSRPFHFGFPALPKGEPRSLLPNYSFLAWCLFATLTTVYTPYFCSGFFFFLADLCPPLFAFNVGSPVRSGGFAWLCLASPG